MKAKRIITTTVFYTVFMFLAGQFVITPERTVGRNIFVAILAGILFTALFVLFSYILAKRKARS